MPTEFVIDEGTLTLVLKVPPKFPAQMSLAPPAQLCAPVEEKEIEEVCPRVMLLGEKALSVTVHVGVTHAVPFQTFGEAQSVMVRVAVS